ncbi:MAG TPA: ATP-binding cassette domain-containing protein [Capsulimonadaceae bacterium]|nr:ATP-binding cassette domain-containing protein [Capsulimonadaceae bacterium]
MSDADFRIEVENLTKDFLVYQITYGSVKSLAAALAKSLILGQNRGTHVVRRVLNDVSFKARAGEVIGLIGRNGSGKSTLLSIISRLYLPTAGEVRLRGKVLGLLELGYSFHPDLTGMENIYFNGILLGQREEQIAERLSDIIAFSGLTKEVVGLPVRMYSSGMQLRLAIAVALHLDTEIILIDEGLVVADQAFQEKVLARLETFKEAGRTIIMVSHVLAHIERVADRIVWLDQGVLRMDGTPAEVLPAYRKEMGA